MHAIELERLKINAPNFVKTHQCKHSGSIDMQELNVLKLCLISDKLGVLNLEIMQCYEFHFTKIIDLRKLNIPRN